MDKGGAPITVLLVDDEPDVAEVTGLHLERRNEDFEVTTEYGAEAALDALEDDVDCVVSDYEMSNKDGLDFLRDVRDYDETLPFILFTGRGSEEIASEAISAGVTDYLQKGTGTDQYAVLANRVENAVARRRSEAAAAETESRYQTLVDSSPNAILVHWGTEVLYVNDRLVDLVGADDADDLAERDPLEFVHPEDRDAVLARIEKIIDDEPADWMEWRLQRLDGEIRRVESRGAPIVYDGERASQVVLRDVTDRYERERRLESLHDATCRLFTAEDRTAVAEITVEVLRDVIGEEVAVFWDHADGDLAMTAATDAARESTLDGESVETVDSLPEWSVEYEVFETGRPRVVTDYDDRDDGVTDALATSYLVPLDEHGLLGIGSTETYTVAPAETELVGILARSVVAALDRVAAGAVEPDSDTTYSNN